MKDVVFALWGLCGVLAFGLVMGLFARVLRLEAEVSRLTAVKGLGSQELSERVKEAAADPTRKIEAIKLYREETGAGLAEARAAVEAYQRTLGQ